MSPPAAKVGLWMIGACGRVGSAVALGVAALRRGCPPTGLVSALPPFARLPLVDAGSIVIGGHEVRGETLLGSIGEAHDRAGLFDENLVRRCAGDLRAAQRNVRPGTLLGAGPTIRGLADRASLPKDRSSAAAVERLSADIQKFRRKHRLEQVVVINVASTEPAFRGRAAHAGFDKLQRAMHRPGAGVLPNSSLYALAAIEAGCPYVNFTPSTGIDLPGLRERAERLGLPYMGRDGKTGETLVKSVLAPMFAMRNLSVLSWVGQNILGNQDGSVLRDPKTRQAKIKGKDQIVSRIVGGKPTTLVSIDYVPSLDDWKVAWDFIHFEGFLGTKMSMQFTWQGADSILAAPLVIDLARFAAHAQACGYAGAMRHLAFYFKDPMDVNEHDLFRQWQELAGYAAGAGRR
jgi:myo-inositol-1-phosphate synthase